GRLDQDLAQRRAGGGIEGLGHAEGLHRAAGPRDRQAQGHTGGAVPQDPAQGAEVTPAEWLSCTDPQRMLRFLQGQARDRQLRLFACACCRRVWDLLPGPGSRAAVLVAERYADGLAGAQELRAAFDAARAEIDPEAFDAENPAYWAAAKGDGFLCAANAV